MAVVEMQKIGICALKENRKAILEKLQKLGIMQMEEDSIDDDELMKMDTAESRITWDKHAELCDQAASILDKYLPEDKGLLGSLEGKERLSEGSLREIIEKRHPCNKIARRILRYEKAVSECNANILKDENLIESLVPWMALDIPLSFEGTGKTSAFIGTMPGALTEEMIAERLREKAPELSALELKVLYTSSDSVNVFVLCMKEDAEAVETALRSLGFARPPQLALGRPEKVAEDAKKDIEKQKTEIGCLVDKIKENAGSRRDFHILGDYYRTRAEKYRLLGMIPQSKNVFFLTGWVPKAAAEPLKELMEKDYGAVFSLEEKAEDETEPTVLKNNPFSAVYEPIVSSYGLPQHGKVDPTTIMSFFYMFFFGMMLSDAGYGLVMVIGTALVLKKYPGMGQGIKKMLSMFFWCGISTTFWGFMYGGFFGDVIDVVAKTFFGYTGATPILKPIWFNPLDAPMQLLIYCMLFGLIHLFFGLGIKGYQYLKEGDAAGFVSDILAWYALLIGLILILLPTDLFGNIAQMTFVFPPAVNMLARILAAAGCAVILLMSGRANKNWGLRIALGAYDIYGITSWLSDVLSYSRLLALGLATGVIAQVINTMAAMVAEGTGFLGPILFILIFLVGSVLNLAINLLGAYVHTNRLQYVEFFGKFYDAGGEPFVPFETKTKYVEMK
ncbi:MAG: V-type ATP synthase subunit I [Lachnospiraceae bacterium]|nr:V-type ATP synthase subunit I [Lachnospiraceae bacterium]